MKRIDKITNTEQYNKVLTYVRTLTDEVIKNGTHEQETPQTEEIKYLGALLSEYENTFLDLKPLKVKSPLIIAIEKEMHRRNLKQRQTAELLQVKENTLSQILSGKRGISMKVAKRLNQALKIDANTILQFA
ncbi:helix-turn-helix domain-containing protein [Bergeyella zoohelcum]|uniref:helix-turn-helix domain-containing protein n=1 Tax=Bergeyella zoohelcum TaxID=1015 RepID=UPI002A911746|nr:helix-turn-helix domain-containing protein [Bergeyella zoohelcum]MDY6024663.1 helix-turn-helix domain-containing protein [Bergeyella zoohelcum]